MKPYLRTLLVHLIAGAALLVGAAWPATAAISSEPGTYASLAPARVLDTRSGVGATGPVAAGGTVSLQVTGRGGVPATGVGAVVLNVTVTQAVAAGFVTVYPSGTAQPNASNLNYGPGQTVPNLVVVKVGADGRVALGNTSTGTVQLIADVAGYYLAGAPASAGAFAPLAPARVLDTRSGVGGSGPVSPGGTMSLQVTGRGGVPATGVGAVVLNVTVTQPTSAGFVTAFPAGTAKPNASNLNYGPGQTVPNLVVVKVGVDGKVALANTSTGTVQLVADVAGYFVAGLGNRTGTFTPVAPSRVLDTRDGTGTGSAAVVRAGGSVTINPFWTAESRGAGAAVLNVTVTQPTAAGFVTVHPAGTAKPNASNLNYGPGQTVPNLVMVKAGSDGSVTLTNTSSGTVHLIADLAGYYRGELPPGALVALPGLSVSGTSYGTSMISGRPGNAASPDRVTLFRTPSGDLGVFAHDPWSDTLTVDELDAQTLQPVTTRRTLTTGEFPIYGGYLAGADGHHYVLLGRSNPDEDDAYEVVEVRRYDGSWNLVGAARLKGGVSQGIKGIYIPFDFGAAHLALAGDRLVVHMPRLMYASSDGLHHQANLTFEVDTTTMTATPFAQLGGYAYSSHSFQQLVALNGSSLLFVDHGDAYPRAIQLGVMAGYPAQRSVATYRLFDFNGTIGNNFTGATVTDLISGPRGAVVLGNSIQHPNAPTGTLGSSSEMRNAYAIRVNPADGTHSVVWLTSFAATGTEEAGEVRAVQVGTDRWAVLFNVVAGSENRTEYRLLDSGGTVLATSTFPGAFFATGSQPIKLGDAVYWLGPTESDAAHLFALDVTDAARPVRLGS